MNDIARNSTAPPGRRELPPGRPAAATAILLDAELEGEGRDALHVPVQRMTQRSQSRSPLITGIHLAAWLWGAAFATLFAWGVFHTPTQALILHRRLHAWAEAPALCGHLALDVVLVLAGFLRGLRLFQAAGNDGAGAAAVI